MSANKGFQCKRCGHCCTNMGGGYSFTVGEEQVEIWELEAPHLLDWLVDSGFGWYDGWIHPRTGEEVSRCPWYRELKHRRFKNKGAHCLIHRHKHYVCQGYPWNIAHGIFTGCKGFSHLAEAEKQSLLREELMKVLRSLADRLETHSLQSVDDYVAKLENDLLERSKALESCFTKDDSIYIKAPSNSEGTGQ